MQATGQRLWHRGPLGRSAHSLQVSGLITNISPSEIDFVGQSIRHNPQAVHSSVIRNAIYRLNYKVKIVKSGAIPQVKYRG